MGDYESDDDNNYMDDENEVQDLEPNFPANPANPTDSASLLNEKKKEFVGSNYPKNNWIQCAFCGVYHPTSMHLKNVTHCGHCWGWVNSNQLDLAEGKYNGANTVDEVKNFLKLTYPLHPNTCVNQECIYNKIKQFAEAKCLNYNFSVELGFIVENKKSNKMTDDSNNSNKSNLEYKIKKNKGNRINYKSSSVTI